MALNSTNSTNTADRIKLPMQFDVSRMIADIQASFIIAYCPLQLLNESLTS